MKRMAFVPHSQVTETALETSRKLAVLGQYLIFGFSLFLNVPLLGQTVTTTANSGIGSLRIAIASGVSGSTITFAPSLSGQTITLTSGQIVINRNLQIDASMLPNGIVINGNDNSRIFSFTSGTVSSLNNLTLTNGRASGATPANLGGAIFVTNATLAINNSTITGNSSSNGGAIYNIFGTLTLNNSILTGNSSSNGGGIYNEMGSVTLNNSIVAGNAASRTSGGIVSIDGPVTLNSSTIISNSAGNIGGMYNLMGTTTLNNSTVAGNSAINVGGGAGGIYNTSGTIRLNNSTIAGNSAISGSSDGDAGGICTLGGSIHLNSSTIASNSAIGSEGAGGIYIFNFFGALMLSNSIVAGNMSSSATPNIFGIFYGANYLTSGNPMLAPLGNYGGVTETMPLLPGSPAIDAGGSTIFTNDQRGLPRLSGEHVDIGAVELQLISANVPPLIKNLTKLDDHTMQFNFTNISGASFRVLTSTNLTLAADDWTRIGFATESPSGSGLFQFTDLQGTNLPQRFYRLKSP